ncbi:hypothetical protein QQ045_018053 [Rhodiola kirilowii]
MFADDLFLFSSGRCSSIAAINSVLEEFLNCSGLSVNVDKSQIFTAGMDDSKKSWVEGLLRTNISSLPVRYLGFPLTTRSISSSDCSAIIQRLTSRLDCWSNQFLSRVGKRCLIQSVLQAIVYYWARICFLSKQVLKAVNSICARFLWNGKVAGRGCHLFSWKTVCQDKKEGGLGIRNLELMNDDMMLNQLWELSKEAQSLWIKWVHAYWTKGMHWWENDNLTNSSWVLRRLAASKQLSSKCVTLEEGRLKWIGEGAGFNVNDTYLTLKSREEEVDWHSLVWNRFNTPSASFYANLTAHDKLLTRARLRSFGMVFPLECALCSEADETRDHLFFCCRVLRNILDTILKFLKVAEAPCQWHLLIPWFKGRNKNLLQTRMLAACITSVIYEI